MFGVVVFPGSNCEQDTVHVISEAVSSPVREIWHKETSLEGIDTVILPGGFSYGDYLRCGSIARFSPIMKSVVDFAERGGVVVGICNGFQILLESGLLPGALTRNSSLKFICKDVYVRTERDDIPAMRGIERGSVLKIPIAHHDGNYFCDSKTLDSLETNNQIVLRYSDRDGEIDFESNPNGSISNIAGICNKKGNVFGLMPHPERCSELSLGNEDGRKIFKALADMI
jgi:phosphoribosylformylglycinamidine synthase